MKILLCEDDHNIATIARLSLENIGKHQLTWAADGESAYNIIIKNEHDAVLLDDMMPKMSGVDVCAKIAQLMQQNANQQVPPVIFMSANPQDKQVVTFSHFVVGYIPKPFDPMSLNAQIAALLTKHMRPTG